MSQEPAYLTLKEVEKIVGVTRATIYVYLDDLDIKTIKLGRSRLAWLTHEDVALIQEYRKKPWIAEERRKAKEQGGEPAVV